MDDVRGYVLGPPHDTIPAAVTTNKNKKASSYKSSGKRFGLNAMFLLESADQLSNKCFVSFYDEVERS